MSKLKKITARELAVFCLMAIFAGIAVGIGATASLLCVALGYGKVVGALLFSVGIYTIISFEKNLFTGMVASIPKMGAKSMWQLPVCFLCNTIGVWIVAMLISFSLMSRSMVSQRPLAAPRSSD